MERRKFLQLFGTSLLVPPLMDKAFARMPDSVASMKEIRRIKIPVGATTPFRALHISDSHLTRVDGRDNDRKKSLSAGRRKTFPKAEEYFDAAVRYAEEQNIILLHTGDMIDFVSEANLDAVAGRLRTSNCFMSAGNHEYSRYVGEAREDEAYKAENYLKVENAYPNNLTMASRVINGVNFVALDDVYYNFTESQRLWMERQVERGLPIVMLCHVPIYTPEHCRSILKSNNGLAGYMTGAPLEVTETYQTDPNLPEDQQWRNRSVQQKADQPTLDFIKWLKKQRLLKAVLCGHCHHFYEERLSPTAMQYTVGAGYAGQAYEIEFV